MVEKKPVNVKWQMVFAVIPILDCYASYRIQKFRLWFLIFWIGGTIVGIIENYAVYGGDYFDVNSGLDIFADPVYTAHYFLFIIVFAAIQAIVMRKFSQKWNKSFPDEQKTS